MDKLLEIFFQPERWEKALEKGLVKDIDKGVLSALTRPETRLRMYEAIRDGKYEITPPHTALIPKDNPGEFRTVYINEPHDRVLLSICNDLLFDMMPEMVHPSCRSYLTGVGCGMVVQDISSRIRMSTGDIGFKADLSKYFDSVPLRYIHAAFDKVEQKHGHSALIDVLRKYYDSNIYIDTDGVVQDKYQSLKQGCSVASWLADVVLSHIDARLCQLDGYYVRYSDDIVFVGPDYQKAMDILSEELMAMDMKLNPKKVEYLNSSRWFKFLGFSIKGGSISMSPRRLKTFQKEIQRRTVNVPKITIDKALREVNRYLYKGFDGHSWATAVLPVINVKEDIDKMNAFVMDCLRGVKTRKKRVGGLGYDKLGSIGCVVRGKGANVSMNRSKVPVIEGYNTLMCMKKALRTSHAAYDAMVRQM